MCFHGNSHSLSGHNALTGGLSAELPVKLRVLYLDYNPLGGPMPDPFKFRHLRVLAVVCKDQARGQMSLATHKQTISRTHTLKHEA